MARRRTRRPRPALVVAALLGCAALPVAAVNALVRWVAVGRGPFLLDPRHIGGKLRALAAYAAHRPGCWLRGGDGDALAAAREAAGRARVDPDLLESLVEAESGGAAHAISPVGAVGPAQLTLSTARDLGVRDPFDPGEATDGAARYLAEQLRRYHGNRALALAAYNAGPGVVHGTVPQNGETELYVLRVLASARRKADARRALERRAAEERRLLAERRAQEERRARLARVEEERRARLARVEQAKGARLARAEAMKRRRAAVRAKDQQRAAEQARARRKPPVG